MFTILSYIVFVLIIYNIPSIVAFSRMHNNAHRIVAMNMALGWTIIGWLIALRWACQPPDADYR